MRTSNPSTPIRKQRLDGWAHVTKRIRQVLEPALLCWVDRTVPCFCCTACSSTQAGSRSLGATGQALAPGGRIAIEKRPSTRFGARQGQQGVLSALNMHTGWCPPLTQSSPVTFVSLSNRRPIRLRMKSLTLGFNASEKAPDSSIVSD